MSGPTLVIQSHRSPLPYPWLEDCLASVQSWAAGRGYDYRFLNDALFDLLPEGLRRKTRDQRVIAADLARLRALQKGLQEGFATVIWCDADLLVFDPERLSLSNDSYALGREVWVQRHRERLRAYVKVHNAFMSFRAGNPFLAFYQDAAERLVRAHSGNPESSDKMAPQFVGPKLLTALHNIVRCPVTETAAMVSPLVAQDLLAGGGAALALFRKRSPEPPAAFNLCASLVANAELSSTQIVDLIELLQNDFVWA
jgi:hypothetical protein